MNPPQDLHWDFVPNRTTNFSLLSIRRIFQSISQLILNHSFGAQKIQAHYAIFRFMDQEKREIQMFSLSLLLDPMVSTTARLETENVRDPGATKKMMHINMMMHISMIVMILEVAVIGNFRSLSHALTKVT